jgi:hypothetical protein
MCWDICNRGRPPHRPSNGKFYTATGDQRRAAAVVVVDGRRRCAGKIPDALRRPPTEASPPPTLQHRLAGMGRWPRVGHQLTGTLTGQGR